MAAPSISRAVDEARISWLCNATRGDPRWKLEQLHGLHELLMAIRDEIVSTVAQDYSITTTLVERQLALVMNDLAAHILNVENKKPSQKREIVRGQSLLEYQPFGVSLILSGSSDPLGDAVAPLAASIAAGNIVILGGVGSNSVSLFSILRRELANYLDAFSIYIVSDVELDRIKVGDLDQVIIFDDNPEKYKSLLSDPKSKFYSTRPGNNFAIVDGSGVNQEKLLQEILLCSKPQELPSRTLSALFVREEIAQSVHQLLIGSFSIQQDSRDVANLEFPRVHLGETEKSRVFVSFLDALQTAHYTGVPAIVTYTSLDQGLDAIEKLEDKVAQISIINPASRKHLEYVKSWTRASFILTDSIRALLPEVLQNSFHTPKGLKPCLYPAAIFSRQQITITNATGRPSGSVESIRNSYEASFPTYKPESRGQRVGFFDQVFYVVQGVGTVVGLLGIVGLWYGGKAARVYLKG